MICCNFNYHSRHVLQVISERTEHREKAMGSKTYITVRISSLKNLEAKGKKENLDFNSSKSGMRFIIPNGCFDAYEVKVNKDIFKYQEKVKLVSQFQRFIVFFNGLLEFASFP